MAHFKYTFSPTNIKFPVQIDNSSERTFRDLVPKLFAHWASSFAPVTTSNEQIELLSQIRRMTEGLSDVQVYELTFCPVIHKDDPIGKFVVRVYPPTRTAQAQEEEQIAKAIGGSKYSNFFVSKLYKSEDFPLNVVVYEHAGFSYGTATKNLADVVYAAVTDRIPETVSEVGRQLAQLLEAIDSVYRNFAGTIGSNTWTGSQYYEQILQNRLYPDIIFNLKNYQVSILDGDIIGVREPEQGIFPHDTSSAHLLTAADLYDALKADKLQPTRWYRLELSIKGHRDDSRSMYTRCMGETTHVWIHFNPKDFDDQKLDTTKLYQLVFSFQPGTTMVGTTQLRKIGFEESSLFSRAELQSLITSINAVETATTYNDLHCKNILEAAGRLQIIDLVSLNRDLPPVSAARLEISIWSELARKKADIRPEQIIPMLELLLSNKPEPSEQFSSAERSLFKVLSAIRTHLQKRTKQELVLAYAAQALLYQRYHLEEISLPDKAIGTVDIKFRLVVEFWLNQLRNKTESPDEKSEPVLSSGVQNQNHIPILADLWERALWDHDQNDLRENARELVKSLLRDKTKLAERPLTPLQQDVFDKCQTPSDDPFLTNRNVIIAAPTSSGKSTLAEMFLVQPTMRNQFRPCALYIAPTRALTQAKYYELVARFSGSNKLKNSILLSTGEDADDDWRINHGLFAIACMVYEKANVLFSNNQRLLEKLGCIVVDEIHMLSNLQRGPVLEVMLTKAIRERSRTEQLAQRHRRMSEEALRIIAISTEDIPTASLRSFMNVNTASQAPIQPIILHNPARPVTVEHLLVLSGKEPKDYQTVSVVEFDSTDSRKLSSQQLRTVDQAIQAARQRMTPNETRSDISQEARSRLICLLLDILREYPQGRRILVFVPGRAIVEQLAEDLTKFKKEAESNKPNRTRSPFEINMLNRLNEQKDEDEAQICGLVRTCAEYGILIHHADMPRHLRRVIEEICDTMDSSAPSQVLFATETLSYGVNLTINDVVLLGVDFRTATRFHMSNMQPLEICSFHNMAGRAGRLGKNSSGNSRVFILVPLNREPYFIVKDYYQKPDETESRIYVNADMDAQRRKSNNNSIWRKVLAAENAPDDSLVHRCADFSSLRASDLSYPFVRTVLDGLRHLSALTANNIAKTPVTLENLLEFFEASLYHEQLKTTDKQKANEEEGRLFVCAIYRILENCAQSPLELVEVHEKDQRLYQITDRGEAIIDTGTEIATVAPLLNLVDEFRKIWNRCMPLIDFPIELYVLCIIAQEEVYREYIYFAPETRGSRQWNNTVASDNRRNVLLLFERSIQRCLETEDTPVDKVAKELRAILERWTQTGKIDEKYLNGAADSILRFYCAIVDWVYGISRATVIGKIEGDKLPADYHGRMQGFMQFRELLHFKTRFLVRMLTPRQSRSSIFLTAAELRDMQWLGQRLRHGCIAAAIPLFYPSKAFTLQRAEAHRLIEKGYLPSKLLLSSDPVELEPATQISVEKLTTLLKNLENYVSDSFEELKEEMVYDPEKEDLRRGSMVKLWDNIHKIFRRSVRDCRSNGDDSNDDINRFISLNDILHTSFVEGMRDATGYGKSIYLQSDRISAEEGYSIRISQLSALPGMAWLGAFREEDDDYESAEAAKSPEELNLTLVGVNFRSDWSVSTNGKDWQTFDAMLHQYANQKHLALITMPWLPMEKNMSVQTRNAIQSRTLRSGYTLSIITPAAFAMMASSIVRNFVSAERCMKLLAEHNSQKLFTGINLQDISELIDQKAGNRLPPSIRETILGHFEVDFY